MKRTLFLFVTIVCCDPAIPSVFGQVDTSNKNRPENSVRLQTRLFPGMPELSQSEHFARQRDLAESLRLANEAFKKGGPESPFTGVDMKSTAQSVRRLLFSWNEMNASPEGIAEFLRNVVLPLEPEVRVFPYLEEWRFIFGGQVSNRSNDRLMTPESLSAEMVRWSLLARQSDALHERLKASLASQTQAWIARVVGVQLAVAEKETRTANQLLEELSKDAAKLDTPEELDWICHAAHAAISDQKSEAAALGLLEAVFDRAVELPTEENLLKARSSWLRVLMIRRHIQSGRKEAAMRIARSVLDKPIVMNRFGGQEYWASIHQLRVEQTAAALTQGGMIAEALEAMVPFAEEQPPRPNPTSNRLNVTAMIGRELKKLTADKRYEMLRAWVIHRGERAAMRDLTGFVPSDAPLGLDGNSMPGAGLFRDCYGTGWHLLTSAKELGKLDDLLQDLAAMSDQSPRVEALRVLGAVLRDGSVDNKAVPARRTGETTVRLQKLLETTTRSVPTWGGGFKAPFPYLTLMVASEAGRHPEWREVARNIVLQLIEHSKVVNAAQPRSHAQLVLTEILRLGGAGNSQNSSLAEWKKLRPRSWVEAGLQSGDQHAGSPPGETWYASEGMVQHVAGSSEAGLMFELPLTGNFQIDLDSRAAGWMEGNVGYGGAFVWYDGYANLARFMGRGRSGTDLGPILTYPLSRENWCHYTIQVNGDIVRYRVNGQLVREDNPGSSSPWLTLGTDWGCAAVFRNFKLTGNPIIPREIPLFADERLRGWIMTHFEETRVTPILELRPSAETVPNSNEANRIASYPMQFMDANWMYRNGELTSARRQGLGQSGDESWAFYQTPLRDGDSVRYEFFHEAGKTEAAPSVGRIAYQFSTDGITRHWLTDGPNDVYSVPPDNGILEKKKITLKNGDWNEVRLSLRGKQLVIALNGVPVVTEALRDPDNRIFGFYHDAAQSSLRIRNAVLTGNWPKELTEDIRKTIEWPEPVESPPNSSFVASVVFEDRVSDNAFEIYRRAMKLDGKSRYDFLHRWVMPNSIHQSLRLAGALTPTHPAPPVGGDHPIDAKVMESRRAVDQRLVQAGGNFVCPAIALVLAAAETNRMEGLKKEVTALDPKSSTEMARSRNAMLGIISLVEGQPEKAVAPIWECRKLVTEQEGTMSARWGDVALASLAIQHPVTRDAAYYLLDLIQNQQLQTGKTGSADFSHFVRHLHGQVHYLMFGGVASEFGTQPKTKQWRAVSHATARSRAEGWPVAAFDTATAELSLRGGHEVDVAYFQSPLRGNYEVTGRLSQNDFHEMMFQVAGIASALKNTSNQVAVRNIQAALPDVALPEAISPGSQAWCDYKIVVKDGHYTSFVNGKKLYETDLPEQPDPWLAVLGIAGNSSRAARNVVITGKPEIPSELDLLAAYDLNGWLTDYYGNATGQSPFAWKQEDGVLMCSRLDVKREIPGRLKIENIIQYHRPLLEDGEVSYEFFYDPEARLISEDPNEFSLGNGQRSFSNSTGREKYTIKIQSLVHPALDRMVCLIEPQGVKVHWLTDGRFDRTGLLPDNSEPVSQPDPKSKKESVTEPNVKVPLKLRDWNAVNLSIKGDTLTIALNGEEIFKRAIEPTNQRQFGLFHFANESDVRVRKIRYRGQWPKTLPPVNQQDLARGPEQFADIPDAKLPETMTWDFTGSKFKDKEFSYHWDAGAAAKQIKPTATGLKFELPLGQKKTNCAGLHPNVRLSGDFIATVEYVDMKTVPSARGWVASGLSFKTLSADQFDAGLETRQHSTYKATRGTWQCFSPLQQYIYAHETQVGFPESGQLRLVRRGTVLYYLTADTGSKNFRLITQRPISTDDKQLNIQADATDETTGVEFTIKNLTVRATKLAK